MVIYNDIRLTKYGSFQVFFVSSQVYKSDYFAGSGTNLLPVLRAVCICLVYDLTFTVKPVVQVFVDKFQKFIDEFQN